MAFVQDHSSAFLSHLICILTLVQEKWVKKNTPNRISITNWFVFIHKVLKDRRQRSRWNRKDEITLLFRFTDEKWKADKTRKTSPPFLSREKCSPRHWDCYSFIFPWADDRAMLSQISSVSPPSAPACTSAWIWVPPTLPCFYIFILGGWSEEKRSGVNDESNVLSLVTHARVWAYTLHD